MFTWVFNPAVWAITVMMAWVVVLGTATFRFKRLAVKMRRLYRRLLEDRKRMRDNSDEEGM